MKFVSDLYQWSEHTQQFVYLGMVAHGSHVKGNTGELSSLDRITKINELDVEIICPEGMLSDLLKWLLQYDEAVIHDVSKPVKV
jgi:hypothetical protein